MSYHSSAFPIEVATINLVMSFCSEPARDIPGNSAGADTVIPNPFHFPYRRSRSPCPRGVLQGARHLTQIPEQARHDAERFLGDRQQDVFIGGVLGAAGIGVWHPDRRQAK